MRSVIVVAASIFAIFAFVFASADFHPTGDTDGDGVQNSEDNCLLVANGPLASTNSCDAQEDGDRDGYGNPCDWDPNNNGGADNFDLFDCLTKASAVSTDPSFDFDCDGATSLADCHWLFNFTTTPVLPGPSGLACAGTVPCP